MYDYKYWNIYNVVNELMKNKDEEALKLMKMTDDYSESHINIINSLSGYVYYIKTLLTYYIN